MRYYHECINGKEKLIVNHKYKYDYEDIKFEVGVYMIDKKTGELQKIDESV